MPPEGVFQDRQGRKRVWPYIVKTEIARVAKTCPYGVGTFVKEGTLNADRLVLGDHTRGIRILASVCSAPVGFADLMFLGQVRRTLGVRRSCQGNAGMNKGSSRCISDNRHHLGASWRLVHQSDGACHTNSRNVRFDEPDQHRCASRHHLRAA